jgi:hypothetical protein
LAKIIKILIIFAKQGLNNLLLDKAVLHDYISVILICIVVYMYSGRTCQQLERPIKHRYYISDQYCSLPAYVL